MAWKTYLIMYFGTIGKCSVSEVVQKVEALGFTSQIGPVDFVYEWGEDQPSKEDIVALGDKLIETLRWTGATFNLDTHD